MFLSSTADGQFHRGAGTRTHRPRKENFKLSKPHNCDWLLMQMFEELEPKYILLEAWWRSFRFSSPFPQRSVKMLLVKVTNLLVRLFLLKPSYKLDIKIFLHPWGATDGGTLTRRKWFYLFSYDAFADLTSSFKRLDKCRPEYVLKVCLIESPETWTLKAVNGRTFFTALLSPQSSHSPVHMVTTETDTLHGCRSSLVFGTLPTGRSTSRMNVSGLLPQHLK